MRIGLITTEAVPFAKVGGLADVCYALPKQLTQLGHTVILILPFYPKSPWDGYQLIPQTQFDMVHGTKQISIKVYRANEEQLTYYFLEIPNHFQYDNIYASKHGWDFEEQLERYALFSKAVLHFLVQSHLKLDILHCNDWHTALIPVYLQSHFRKERWFKKTKTVFTIHNLNYQGIFPVDLWHLTDLDWSYFTYTQLEFYNHINLMKGAIVFADRITTVSRTYAEEIQTPALGNHLNEILVNRRSVLKGILNGVEPSLWNPETDPHLFGLHYSTADRSNKSLIKQRLLESVSLPYQPDIPLVGMITRLSEQKGFDLLFLCWESLLQQNVQFIVLGDGDDETIKRLLYYKEKYPRKFHFHKGFSEPLAHQIEAGADLFLMPSRFEPCGLNQMYSMIYGTLPIVHHTGGLADTVQHLKTGFSFRGFNAHDILHTVLYALKLFQNKEVWDTMILQAMNQDFSWEKPALEYELLYYNCFSDVEVVKEREIMGGVKPTLGEREEQLSPINPLIKVDMVKYNAVRKEQNILIEQSKQQLQYQEQSYKSTTVASASKFYPVKAIVDDLKTLEKHYGDWITSVIGRIHVIHEETFPVLTPENKQKKGYGFYVPHFESESKKHEIYLGNMLINNKLMSPAMKRAFLTHEIGHVFIGKFIRGYKGLKTAVERNKLLGIAIQHEEMIANIFYDNEMGLGISNRINDLIDTMKKFNVSDKYSELIITLIKNQIENKL